MKWNKENILHFISLIRERPVIWDSQSPEHKSKQKRQDAAEEVAMLMGVTAKEVNAKWCVLRNQYSREKRRMAGTGSGADSIYKTKWFAYKKMESMMSSNTPIGLNCLEIKINNIESDDSLLMPSCTTTSPPPCSPTLPPRVQQGKQRESYSENSVYAKAVESLKVMMEKNWSTDITRDDLTSYGLYIAAHLRKFPTCLQSKARFEINNILYSLDKQMEKDNIDSI